MKTDIQVVYTTYIDESWDDDEDFDEDFVSDTYEEHIIHGIEKNKKLSDFSVPFNIVKDKEYYLVTALYDTGCSMYRECGKIEFVDLLETKEKAEQICKIIEENDETKYLQLFRENDVSYKFDCPWIGYFEDLVSVSIETVNLLR